MFKAQVLRRSFSLFNRVPHSRIVRSAVRDGHETVTIQRVRISTPFFSKSRLVGAVVIGAATYTLGRYIGIEVEIGEIEEEDKRTARPGSKPGDEEGWQKAGEEQEGEEEDDEDYDDALFFLPTGLSRPKPKKYYRGSDPEWQEFRKVATDRPRVEKIRGELVKLIRDVAQKSPGYVARLGTIDVNKGKIWIEFKFPDGPPTEYERPGIELTDELVWRKASRPVEDVHHQRLNKVLFPVEASTALYQDTKRKAELSWKSFRTYIGWDPKPEPETVQTAFQRVLANAPPPPSADVSPSPASPSPAAPEGSAPASSTPSVQSATKDLGFVLPDPKNLTLDLSQFRRDFQKAWKGYDKQVPRGAFMVLGLVEIYGDRSRMTLNVTAFYDPKQARYVALQARAWNIVEHRQHPKGGN